MPYEESPLYRIKSSKRARRLALRLDPIERIFHLTVPARCPMAKAYHFADSHEEWMLNTLNDLPEPCPFINGAIIPLCGKQTKIKIHLKPDAKITKIAQEKDSLIITTNKNDPSSRIERYLKNQAKNILKEKSEEKAVTISKKIENITVRDTKSRWGSCSSEKTLSYSWRLIFAPPEAMDYVVAHEVAHLKHLDHSRAFWSLCRQLSDNFIDGQYWMQNHGHELMKYGTK